MGGNVIKQNKIHSIHLSHQYTDIIQETWKYVKRQYDTNDVKCVINGYELFFFRRLQANLL